MNILKKLATPFIAVGRWIKETAWVQPLLIVGIIFGVIFSIPSITSAIQDAMEGGDSDDIAWYKNNQLSLDGTYNKDSDVNKFFSDYVDAQASWAEGDKTEAKEIMGKYSNNGGKFFLFFVQDDCSACNDTKDASEYLIENWDNEVDTEKFPGGFQYRSIICDEDIDKDEYEDQPAFEFIFGDANYYKFAEACNNAGTNNNYYYHTSSDTRTTINSNLKALLESDDASSSLSSNFQTPLCVLIDTTETNDTNYIISTLFYSCEGSNKFERADFLADCWQGKGLFSKEGK